MSEMSAKARWEARYSTSRRGSPQQNDTHNWRFLRAWSRGRKAWRTRSVAHEQGGEDGETSELRRPDVRATCAQKSACFRVADTNAGSVLPPARAGKTHDLQLFMRIGIRPLAVDTIGMRAHTHTPVRLYRGRGSGPWG